MKVRPSRLAQSLAVLPLLATTEAFLFKPASALITVPAGLVAPARCAHIAVQRQEYLGSYSKQRRSSLTRLFTNTPESSGPTDPLQPRKFSMRAVLTLLVGELLIGALGLPLGKYFSVDPFATLLTVPAADSVVKGALLTLPLLVFHFLSGRDIDAMLKEGLKEVFGDELGLGWLLFLSVLLSASAGIGEEILFRGALQPILAAKLGPLAGIGISSALFGMLHAATPRYFLLAAILSAYLGYIQLHYSCLLIPIVIHTLFDVIGFVKHTMLTSVLAHRLTRSRQA